MAKLQYTCTLLSDVILNRNSGTRTQQSTLDFIPGNTFLGIVAASLYPSLSPEDSLKLFHSGKVRFGDAHPLCNGTRSLRIPAALYYKKGEELNDGTFLLYKWDSEPGAQPKQCRSGFYAFIERNAFEVKANKSVAIKSAYDRELRRSKDEAIYSYESLRKGIVFAFEIDYDEEAKHLVEKLNQSLCGRKHIGHSKTAQYGLVDIESAQWNTVESSPTFEPDVALVYADARLIFLDNAGTPTFRPSAQDLGFSEGAEVDWERSQIRTFQYAPWNSKRQNPDTDRCGLEKGSVLVVKLNGTQSPTESKYVGDYKAEGFGNIIYNPSFLKSDDRGYSQLVFKTSESNGSTAVAGNSTAMNDWLLCHARTRKAGGGNTAYEIANKFIDNYAKEFKKSEERFASQWGYIRTLADSSTDLDTFLKKLDEYLSHGVAEEKWTYKKKYLFDFIKKDVPANSGIWREIMVNLASEMAKQCKR